MGKGYSLITLTIKRGEILMKAIIIYMRRNKTKLRQSMCHFGLNTLYLWVRYCPLVPGSTLISVD